ncbi:unnamed protein product [Penicillium viridicatum]
MVENGQVIHEADLDIHRDSGLRNENVTNVRQSQRMSLATENPDQCPLVEAVSDSHPAFIPAESDSHHSVTTNQPNTSRGYSLGEEQAPKDTRGTFAAKKIGLQDLLYAARPLGDFAMWAYGLQVMRKKPCDSTEMSSL